MDEIEKCEPVNENMVVLAGVIYNTMVDYYDRHHMMPPHPISWPKLPGCPVEVLDAKPAEITDSVTFLTRCGFLKKD